jgi:hypothetical protein
MAYEFTDIDNIILDFIKTNRDKIHQQITADNETSNYFYDGLRAVFFKDSDPWRTVEEGPYVRTGDNPHEKFSMEWYLEEARNNLERVFENTETGPNIRASLEQIINDVQSARSVYRRINGSR